MESCSVETIASRVLAPIPLVAPAKTHTRPEDLEVSAAKAELLCFTDDRLTMMRLMRGNIDGSRDRISGSTICRHAKKSLFAEWLSESDFYPRPRHAKWQFVCCVIAEWWCASIWWRCSCCRWSGCYFWRHSMESIKRAWGHKAHTHTAPKLSYTAFVC